MAEEFDIKKLSAENIQDLNAFRYIRDNLFPDGVENAPSIQEIKDKQKAGKLTVREAYIAKIYSQGFRVAPLFLESPDTKDFAESMQEKFGTKKKGTAAQSIGMSTELKSNLKQVSLDDVYEGGIKGSTAINTGVKKVLEDDLPKTGEKGAKKLGKKATEVSADIIQAMAKGISNIPDYNVRATVFAGMFGARLSDVIGMRTTRRLAEMGSQPRPYFDVETGVQENPERTGRKQAGPSKTLPPVFQELARKLHAEAGSDGVIFKATRTQVANALKKYVFPEVPKEILDKLDRDPKDFTDLRRIIAAYVIKNVNPSAASGIISHKLTSAEQFDKVMDTFYVGIDDPKGDVERTKGLILFEKELAKGLNVTDGRQLGQKLKLDLPDSFNSIYPDTKITVSPTGEKLTSTVEVSPEEQKRTDKIKIAQDFETEQDTFLRGEQKREKGITLAESNIARQKKIDADREERKQKVETPKEVKPSPLQEWEANNPDKASKAKRKSKRKFDRSPNTKLYGISGALSAPLAYMAYKGYKDEYVNEGMEDMDATINASIMTASDFIPHIMMGKMFFEPKTVAASERDPFEMFKTKEQMGQEVIDIAKERTFREDMSSQMDDELAIQKQMNIKKMSEDFSSEAERKSQLSLDEQMQLINQGS
jgi:hypothetical protein|tara:strand:- start:814 stop:2766 length:1953 start_codon:yes stop_codon:yes gene_type:complete